MNDYKENILLNNYFIEAVLLEDFEVANRLIKKGIDINFTNSHGWTALMLASNECQINSVRYLLNMCAKIEIQDDCDDDALSIAKFWGYEEIIKLLEEKEMNRNQEELNRIFFDEVRHGKLEELKESLDNGISIDLQDKRGWNALMISINYNRIDVVKYLLDKGADINIKSKEGITAHSLIKETTYKKIIKLLEDKMSKGIKKEKGADYFKKKCSKLAKAISTCSVKALDSALTNVTGLVKDITKRLDEKKK